MSKMKQRIELLEKYGIFQNSELRNNYNFINNLTVSEDLPFLLFSTNAVAFYRSCTEIEDIDQTYRYKKYIAAILNGCFWLDRSD